VTTIYPPPRTARLAVDDQLAVLPLTDFYLTKHLPGSVRTFRWTQMGSSLDLPNPGQSVGLQLFIFGRPSDPAQVHLAVGDAHLDWFIQPKPRRYDLVLPATGRDLF